MTSCFSYFTVNILKTFRVMVIARENRRPVPLNAISTGGPAPFADAAIETPPVMTVYVIRPV